jgi:hypothetical protein
VVSELPFGVTYPWHSKCSDKITSPQNLMLINGCTCTPIIIIFYLNQFYVEESD